MIVEVICGHDRNHEGESLRGKSGKLLIIANIKLRQSKGNKMKCSLWNGRRHIQIMYPIRGWEDPLEKGKATHSSILASGNPWTVQFMGLQRVRHSEQLSLTLIQNI